MNIPLYAVAILMIVALCVFFFAVVICAPMLKDADETAESFRSFDEDEP